MVGLWVAFQGLTGLVLLFGDSIEHWRHADLTRHGRGDRGAAEALAVVRQNYPGERVGVLATPAVSGGVYVVEVGEREVYVDPAGPRINGSRNDDGGFLALVGRLHRRFLFDSLFGLSGAWVVGVLGVAWLVLSIGGFTAAASKRLTPRWRGDPSALQRLIGVSIVIPIVVVIVTGIRLALPAGTDRVWAAVTGSGVARPDIPPDGVRITSEDRGAVPRDATEILNALQRRYPDGRVARLLMPQPDDRVAPVIAGISLGFDPGRHEDDYGGNAVIFVDQYTAETLWAGRPDTLPAARQAALLWSRPLHTGSVAGDAGRLLWAALAVVILALTSLGWGTGRARAGRARARLAHHKEQSWQRQLRRRKALARRRRVHAARATRTARLRRRSSRRLRRRRKVQARILARQGWTPPDATPPVPDTGGDFEIDLTDNLEIDLTDRADVDVDDRS